MAASAEFNADATGSPPRGATRLSHAPLELLHPLAKLCADWQPAVSDLAVPHFSGAATSVIEEEHTMEH